MAERARRIVLTGGGSAGHVTPNLALLPLLRAGGWQIEYVGSHAGIERELVRAAELPYHAIQTGKLRRYLSARNALDALRTLAGVAQAFALLGRLRPQLVFSKGGFVAVPVVCAAWLRGIPVVVHESDHSPGLANRLSFPFAARICTSFADTALGPRERPRAVVTGSPVRPELLRGDARRAQTRWRLDPQRPLVLAFGGSLGAQALNAVIFEWARSQPADLQFLHVCGKGNLDPGLADAPHYRGFEYLNEEFPDALARADAVVCRAGANSLAELLALRKPAVLVPLPLGASRGDQLENARYFAERGHGLLLPQEELDRERLERALRTLLAERETYRARMERDAPGDAGAAIVAQIESAASAGHTRAAA